MKNKMCLFFHIKACFFKAPRGWEEEESEEIKIKIKIENVFLIS